MATWDVSRYIWVVNSVYTHRSNPPVASLFFSAQISVSNYYYDYDIIITTKLNNFIFIFIFFYKKNKHFLGNRFKYSFSIYQEIIMFFFSFF